MQTIMRSILTAVTVLMVTCGLVSAQSGGGLFGGFAMSQCYYFFHEAPPDTTVSGTVLVDSVIAVPFYYLDADADETADFRLGFGPRWYDPDSVSRPEAGESVTVTGKFVENHRRWERLFQVPTVMVETLNGELWRDLSKRLNWSGRWIRSDSTDTTVVYCSEDSSHQILFPPGWRGHGPDMMQSSALFADIIQMIKELMPGDTKGMLKGFNFALFDSSGTEIFRSGKFGQRGKLRFRTKLALRLHCLEHQLASLSVDLGSLTVCYWDKETQSWIPFGDLGKGGSSGVYYDIATNSFVVSTEELHEYVGIFAAAPTSVEGPATVEKFALIESYPNPFNPEATIRITLNKTENLNITIFNILGQKVRTITNGNYAAGNHTFKWDGRDSAGHSAANGIYFVIMHTPTQKLTKKITLLK